MSQAERDKRRALEGARLVQAQIELRARLRRKTIAVAVENCFPPYQGQRRGRGP